MKRYILAACVVVFAVLLSSCGYNIPSDMVAVQVGSGPTESKKVKGCKPSADRGFWSNDTYALFPTSEREWDATGQKGSDGAPFKSVTKDNVEMSLPVTVRFTLITDCDQLKKFYTNYARRYGVEFSDDGSYNDQWLTLLRKLVADPAQQTLDRIIQKYTWRQVWNDPATKIAIEKEFNEALTRDGNLLEVTAKDEYFESVSVLVGKAQPTNADLATAVALEQTNVAKAQSAEAQAKADKMKAEAETSVAQAEAAKQRAQIAGYGSVEAYLKSKAIEKGINPWQPSYGSPVTSTP